MFVCWPYYYCDSDMLIDIPGAKESLYIIIVYIYIIVYIIVYRVMPFVPITIIFKVEINKCIVMLHNQNWGRGARYACFDITEISILIKHSRFSILFFIYALTLLLLRRRLADTVKSNKNCNHNSDS